jgi:polyhydroxybutyrate depolymerase
VLLSSGCLTELPVVGDPCAAWDKPGLYELTIEREDTKNRKAVVYMPEGPGPHPVVTMLHGAGQTNDDIGESTQWIRNAGQEGAVVVFPQGILRSWNAGECCLVAAEGRRAIDDVGYLEELARTVKERTCGAEHLVGGFSNGGMMAHRWACEGKEVDAVMPSAGPLWLTEAECQGPPVPIRHYHGSNDTTVPFEGGQSARGRVVYPSIDASMEIWRNRNGCSTEEPEVVVDGDTTCRIWSCDVPTETCLIQGMGHQWPGGANRGPLQHDATVDGYAWFLQ